MPIGIQSCRRNIPNIGIKIQRLRISKVGVRHSRSLGCPVWRDESSERVPVVASAEVIETGFGVPFFAGELVMIGGDLRVVFFAVRQHRALPYRPAAAGGHYAGAADLVAVVVVRGLRHIAGVAPVFVVLKSRRGVGLGQPVGAGGNAALARVERVYRSIGALDCDIGIPRVPHSAGGIGVYVYIRVADDQPGNGREINDAVVPAAGYAVLGGDVAVLVLHRGIAHQALAVAGRIAEAEAQSGLDSGTRVLPHKELVSALNGVSVQVAETIQVPYLALARRTARATAGGGAYMQARIVVVGFGNALASGVDIVAEVVPLIALGDDVAAEIEILGIVRARV